MPATSPGSSQTESASSAADAGSNARSIAAVQTQTRIEPQASMVTETPRSADAFVDSVGMNTHFDYFTTPYVTNYAKVEAALTALGVRHIRDSLDDHGWTTFPVRLAALAAAGIHTDVTTSMGQTSSQIIDDLKLLPNVADAIEAPNEYDLTGDPNWISKLRDFQSMLYSTMKSTLHVAYPVYGPSITSYRDSLALGNLSNELDMGTMHNYFANVNPGTVGGTPFPVGKYNSLQFWMGTGHLISGSKPLVTTETGYEDSPAIPNNVPPSVKARYVLRELLLQFNAGVVRTYFYEMIDQGGQSLGFLDANANPKPVYIALQNLLHKLSDRGPSFALTPLTYSMTADPTVAHTLLQKRDGSYRLMSWVEVHETDPATPTQTVVLKTASRFGLIEQYKWNDDGSIQTVPLFQKSDGTITLQVTDRISEIKLQK